MSWWHIPIIICLIGNCCAIEQNDTKVVVGSPPIFDVEITKEVNFGASFTKTSSGIFMMAANNVFHLNVTKDDKRFDRIAKIDDFGEDVTGFEAVSWEDQLIFIVTHIDYFNVYLVEVERSDTVLSPVQKVAIYGKYVKVLCFTERDDLFLVIGTNFTEAHGRLSLYKWEQSSFHLQEEKNLQSISDLMVLTESSSAMVFTVKYAKRRSSKTSVQTFIISENKLKRTHNLYVDSNLVVPVPQNGTYYIVACSNRLSVCLTYTVADEDLEEYGKETLNMTLSKLAYGKDYIIAEVPGGEFLISTDVEMKSFEKFTINQTDFVTSSNMITTEDQAGGNYAIIAYTRPDRVQLKIVEINLGSLPIAAKKSDNTTDDLQSLHKTLYTSLSSLRKMLFHRKDEVEDLKDIMGWRGALDKNRIVIKAPLYAKSGTIQKIVVENRNFLSLPELKDKLDMLRERLRNLTARAGRSKRSVGDDLKLKTLRVHNLLYSGNVFEGIEKVEDSRIIIKADSVVTKSINVEQFEKHNKTLALTGGRSLEFPDNGRSHVITENVTVREVIVGKINGIAWNTFYEEVFLKNRDAIIRGDVTLKGPTNVDALSADKINGRHVADFFTLTTPQEVSSTLLVAKAQVPSIETDDLNGIRFDADVATTGKDIRFIESPVVARSVKIQGNLTLSKDDRRTLARHVISDPGSEFLQIYVKKVAINGTLTVSHLHLEQPDLETYIDGKRLIHNFEEMFWLKSVDQNFDDVTFRGVVAVKEIKADRLNGVDISNHLLDNYDVEGNVLLVINSSTIRGSVANDNEIAPSKLVELDNHIIRKGQRAVCLDGVKIFAKGVKTDHLETERINAIPAKDLVRRDATEIIFSGPKGFSSVVVDSQFHTDRLQVKHLNGRDIEEFFKNSVSLHRNVSLSRLVLTGRSSFRNIYFGELNNYDISKAMDILEVTDEDRIVLHKTITVEGDAIFEEGVGSVWINDLHWNDYLKLVVFLNESTEIGGVKTFTDTLMVSDTLKLHQINGLNANEFFEGFLLQSRPQTVKDKWTFGSVVFNGDLTAPYIDGIDTELLIDTSSTSPSIESDLIVQDLKIIGGIYGMTDHFHLHQIKHDLATLDRDYWRRITVLKSAELNDNNWIFNYVANNAVLMSTDQVIAGRVIFTSEVFLESVNGSHSLQGIDPLDLPKNCLLKRAHTEQIIMSHKQVVGDLVLSSAAAHEHFGAEIVNDVDIFGFNASIYRLDGGDVILGEKVFKNLPKIEHLQVYGTVNGADLHSIVHTTDLNRALPPVRLMNATIHTPVAITQVNGLNFDCFLRGRARLQGPEQEFLGDLNFERLTLLRNATITSVNEIYIDDLITRSSQSLQEVYGRKTITGDLYLVGPAHVGYLNGVDITTRYERTLNINSDYSIPEALLSRANFESGISVGGAINGHHVDEYFLWHKIYNDTSFRSLQEVNSYLIQIHNSMHRQFVHSRLLYLEHETSVHGIWGKYIKNAVREEIVRPSCVISEKNCLCRAPNLHLQISPSGRTYISTPKNPRLQQERDDFKVAANNFCDDNSTLSELFISWSSGAYQKNITLHSFVGGLQTFQLPNTPSKFIMIQFVVGVTNTPLILVKVDFVKNEILTLQNFKEGVGAELAYKVYTFSENTFMVMTSGARLSVYEFQPKTELFTIVQQISGIFNAFELIQVDRSIYHLILTRKSPNILVIYAINTRGSLQFEIFQNIRIRGNIKRVNDLTGPYGTYMAVTTAANGDYYYLFQYCYIQGWIQAAYGHFPGIEAILPLQHSPNLNIDRLLVTSWNRSAIVTVHSQEY